MFLTFFAVAPQVPAEATCCDSSPGLHFQPRLQVVKGQAGFWRVAQDSQGVWWFLSPENKREFMSGVQFVHPFQGSRSDADGAHFVSRDWSGDPHNEDDLRAWGQKTIERILGLGFKSIGAWSHRIFHQLNIPISRDLNLTLWEGVGLAKMFEPEWEAALEIAVRAQVSGLRENRNLLGYFLDNEVGWEGEMYPDVFFVNDAFGNPTLGKIAVIQQIRQLWPTLSRYNDAWQPLHPLRRWDDLLAQESLTGAPDARRQLYTAWIYHCAKRYFKTTSALLRKYDPNHLNLGVRFHAWTSADFVRGARGYSDVQSINYYDEFAKFDPTVFATIYQESGQPILISEYMFHSVDLQGGYTNRYAMTAQVANEEAKAHGFALMNKRAATVPYIVGLEWFQWNDEPPGGRGAGVNSDGQDPDTIYSEDWKSGIVDINDWPHPEMEQAVRNAVPLLNRIHRDSSRDEPKWRDLKASTWHDQSQWGPSQEIPLVADQDAPLSGARGCADEGQSPLVPLDPPLKIAGVIDSEAHCSNPPTVEVGAYRDGLLLRFHVPNPAPTWGEGVRWDKRDRVSFRIGPRSSETERYFVYNHVTGTFGRLAWNERPYGPSLATERRYCLRSDGFAADVFIPRHALHEYSGTAAQDLEFEFRSFDYLTGCQYYWASEKDTYNSLGGFLKLRTRVPGR